ncbi:MAG: 2-amino-4-hydroxy-6-hydroxymethyldihydropteridine diphosphokinase [Candidatus Omnitrophica bacterium]|nr:2-amino-4-hydroxy-6-hydroxymethyldihydropteridine diphosphokinase [Candidatus Omnitrophota bacterium]
MVISYLGIGSNIGQRRKNIDLALNKIRGLKHTKIVKIAPIIETLPQGGPKGQRRYLNTVVKIKTSLKPLYLLKKLKEIEKELGRTPTVKNGPRIIDLDILLYADRVINTKKLKIPHPRIFEREFVLKPLSYLL